jgi:hypothetical protein
MLKRLHELSIDACGYESDESNECRRGFGEPPRLAAARRVCMESLDKKRRVRM